MKTYLEVAQDVFRKGDDYLRQKEQKRSRIKKGSAAGLLAVLCIAVFGLLKPLSDVKNPVLKPKPTESAYTDETIPIYSDKETAPDVSSATKTNDPSTATNPPRSDKEIAPDASSATKTNDSSITTNPTRSHKETASSVSSATETNDSSATTVSNRNSDELTTGARIAEKEPKTSPESKTEPATQKGDEVMVTESTKENVLTTLSGAASYNGSAMLQAAIEKNVCGWIRYNGAYYLQDDWSNGNTIENCELIGSSSSVEGNLQRLGLTGDVFLVTDGNYSGCLLLRTDAGRNIVFIHAPSTQ